MHSGSHKSGLGSAYRPDIDGIRGIAVALVVAFHAFPKQFPAGYVGVDVFFVISGFLISGIILGGLQRDTFRFRDFYARRIKRIFPALAIVLAATAVIGWSTLIAESYSQLGKHIFAGAAFVANFAYYREAGYFNLSSEMKPLIHLWSLGIEEQFYLLWPLLMWLTWKRRSNLLALILLIVAVSFALNVYYVDSNPSAAFFLPFTRFWELLLGSLLAFATLRHGTRLAAIDERLSQLANIRAFAGVGLLVLGLYFIRQSTVFPGWWALLPTVGTGLLISAGPQAWLNRKLLANPALVWIGLISYPLYLWHWPLLSFAQITHFGAAPTNLRIALVLLALVLASLTYLLLEKPIRFGGNSRPKVFALSLSMAVMCLVGLNLVFLRGLEHRPINNDARLVFLWRYANLANGTDLASAYRLQCDFYAEVRFRRSIAQECTSVTPGKSVFLWGDSHAEALSLGIREALAANHVQLAQVATSTCPPLLVKAELSFADSPCTEANAYALKQIARLRPEIVVLAQRANHLSTNWEEIAAHLHALGVAKVILVGPTPQWEPSLPLVLAGQLWDKPQRPYVHEGLNALAASTDEGLQRKYASSTGLTYVSLMHALCTSEGCLARVPGSEELMVIDYGHLSPLGSEYVGREVLAKELRPAS